MRCEDKSSRAEDEPDDERVMSGLDHITSILVFVAALLADVRIGISAGVRPAHRPRFRYPWIIGQVAPSGRKLSRSGCDAVRFSDCIFGVSSDHARRLLRGGIDQNFKIGEVSLGQRKSTLWNRLGVGGED